MTQQYDPAWDISPARIVHGTEVDLPIKFESLKTVEDKKLIMAGAFPQDEFETDDLSGWLWRQIPICLDYIKDVLEQTGGNRLLYRPIVTEYFSNVSEWFLRNGGHEHLIGLCKIGMQVYKLPLDPNKINGRVTHILSIYLP